MRAVNESADNTNITNYSTTKVARASDRGFMRLKNNSLSGWNTVTPAVGSVGNHGSEIYYVGV